MEMTFSKSREGGVLDSVMVNSWDQLGCTDRCPEDWGGRHRCLWLFQRKLFPAAGAGRACHRRVGWPGRRRKDKLCLPSPSPGVEAPFPSTLEHQISRFPAFGLWAGTCGPRKLSSLESLTGITQLSSLMLRLGPCTEPHY